ncbi:transposase [Parasphingorhabdus sp. DH2-15]|uniref:transposase n=1 Tax=Parasphingorhabdus sp. DH2-15 TaxID=3444112 RepID=UPI003F686B0C
MALDIAYRAQEPLSLDEALSLGDANLKGLEREQERENAAHILAGLYANRDFLADAAIDALKLTYADETQGRRKYGPQVITLGAARPGWFLRANIWPGANDYVVRASGKDAFFYGLPHDHNFDFLTIGYHGPGYISDYYEQDYEAIIGYKGEPAGLRFIERSALSEGRMLYYRKHRDVHCQHAPDALSISLNIMMTAPEQYWFDQCRYDVKRNVVETILSQGANEAMLHIAVAAGDENGRDLATEILWNHPSQRMQLAALQALSENSLSQMEKDKLFDQCCRHGSAAIAAAASLYINQHEQ